METIEPSLPSATTQPLRLRKAFPLNTRQPSFPHSIVSLKRSAMTMACMWHIGITIKEKPLKRTTPFGRSTRLFKMNENVFARIERRWAKHPGGVSRLNEDRSIGADSRQATTSSYLWLASERIYRVCTMHSFTTKQRIELGLLKCYAFNTPQMIENNQQKH